MFGTTCKKSKQVIFHKETSGPSFCLSWWPLSHNSDLHSIYKVEIVLLMFFPPAFNVFDVFIVFRGFSNGPIVERTRHFLGQLQTLLISSGGLRVSSMSPQDFFFFV